MKEEATNKQNELPTVIGFMILFICVLIPYTGFEIEKLNLFSFVILFLFLIINCKWVSNIAKKKKRGTTFWSIFAFLIPPLSLIILGLLDVKKPDESDHSVSAPAKDRAKIGNLYLEDDETKEFP
jgi:hypothetical protein